MAIFDDPSVNVWTFINVNFARIADESNIWFGEDTIMTIEPVFGSAAPYIDTAGVQRTELSVRAAFEHDGVNPPQVKRDFLLGKRGAVGTLANGRGRSCKAILRTATPVPGDSTFAYADCVFVFVS